MATTSKRKIARKSARRTNGMAPAPAAPSPAPKTSAAVEPAEPSLSERLDAVACIADSADLATYGACCIDTDTSNRSLLAAALACGDDAQPVADALRAIHDDLYYGLRSGCIGMEVREQTVQDMIERIARRVEVLAEVEARLWRQATWLLARERQAKAVST